MTIRKFVVAGLVLAAVGLTVTVATAVIGQQPGTAAKKEGAVERAVPASGTTKSAADEFSGAAPPAADSGRLSGTDEGTPADPAGADAGSEVAAPPTGEDPLLTGAAPGKAKGPSKSSAKTPRSGSARSGGGMMMPGMMPGAGMSGMPDGGSSGMRGMPGGGMSGGMMPGMGSSGGGGMPAPVPEDEHLETWVNQALADYAQTEDQAARKQQRELIAKALDQIFDIRQERRMEELETLEQRVQRLRGTLETREKLKTDILKNRLDYLIREADGLGWGDGLPAPTGFGASGSSSSSSNPLKRPAPGGIRFWRGPPPATGGIGAGSGPPPASAPLKK